MTQCISNFSLPIHDNLSKSALIGECQALTPTERGERGEQSLSSTSMAVKAAEDERCYLVSRTNHRLFSDSALNGALCSALYPVYAPLNGAPVFSHHIHACSKSRDGMPLTAKIVCLLLKLDAQVQVTPLETL